MAKARTAPVIAVFNMKGGVGKTTIAGNVFAELFSHVARPMLLVDFDAQFNLTQLLLTRDDYDKLDKAGRTIHAVLQHPPADIPDLLDWLAATPVRRALAVWDHAQRRARAVRDEADRRAAIDTLKATITASTDPVEKRRAAASILRTLDRRTTPARHHRHRHMQHAASPEATRRGDRSTQHDPERFLEREKRENDRLEKLLHCVTGLSESAQPGEPAAPEPAAPRPTVTAIMRDYNHRIRAINQQHRRDREQSEQNARRVADLLARAGYAPGAQPTATPAVANTG